MSGNTDGIRLLNDQLRQNLSASVAVITPGIAALGQEAVERIVKTVAVFDDFHHDNDPHQEHDFGIFEADGNQILFRITYLDSTMSGPSPNPSDPLVTNRVISIALVGED